MRTVFIVLVLALATVRSEYTWNGSEWVWSEDKNPTQAVETNFEGSGDSDSDYADENEDDSFDYYDGSGDDEEDAIEDSYSPQQPNTDFQNPRNNYEDPYAGQGWNPDPRDPYDPTYRNSNNQQNNNNFNSQFSPSYPTQPPYFGNEVETTDDIYVDPPQQNFPPTPATTTAVPPRDPSISSRPKSPSRSTSFFAQPGTLAAVIGGAVVGLLCAILCVMFVVYRMRKKDEGSYALDEPKRSPTVNAYAKHPSREFYA